MIFFTSTSCSTSFNFGLNSDLWIRAGKPEHYNFPLESEVGTPFHSFLTEKGNLVFSLVFVPVPGLPVWALSSSWQTWWEAKPVCSHKPGRSWPREGWPGCTWHSWCQLVMVEWEGWLTWPEGIIWLILQAGYNSDTSRKVPTYMNNNYAILLVQQQGVIIL